jgi:hypothetical protein
MKRTIVVLLGSMLLILGVAGCGSSNGSGPGTTSATSVPGY